MSCAKSTLYASSEIMQDLAVGQSLSFQNAELTGCAITYTAGNTAIELTNPGVYSVSVSATGVSANSSSDIGLQLYQNGTAIHGALSTGTSCSTTDFITLSFNAIVQTPCNCDACSNKTSISIRAINSPGNYENAQVTIVKVC